MGSMTKRADLLAATGGDDVSYLNLFNPLSPLMGGGDKYPEIAAEMFPRNPRLAWLLSKSVATGLLAAGIAGGVRLLQDSDEVHLNTKNDPAEGVRSDLSTTFSSPLTPKKEEKGLLSRMKDKLKGLGKKASSDDEPVMQRVEHPEVLDRANIPHVAIPAAAALLAASGAWYATDSIMDNIRANRLDKSIARRQDYVNGLMQIRAKQAKGTLTPEQAEAAHSKLRERMRNEGMLDKNASGGASRDSITEASLRAGMAGGGVLLLALALAAGGASYSYFSASDENNIKYKAMKKGLRTYSQSKAMASPITQLPSDAGDYFRDIDGDDGTPKKSAEGARALPEIGSGGVPIRVTL